MCFASFVLYQYSAAPGAEVRYYSVATRNEGSIGKSCQCHACFTESTTAWFTEQTNDWPWLALNEWVDGKRTCKRNQKKWLNHRMTNSASALSPVSSQLLIIWAASERCLLWNASSLRPTLLWPISSLIYIPLFSATSWLSYLFLWAISSLSYIFVRAIYFVCQLLLLWATSSVDHFFSELPSLWPISFSQPLPIALATSSCIPA